MTRLRHETPTTGLLCAVAALLLTGCREEGLMSPTVTRSEVPPVHLQAAAPVGKWRAFEVLQTNAGPPPPFETRIRGNTRHDLGVQVSGTLDVDIVGTFTATVHAHLHQHPTKQGVYVGPAKLDGTWIVTALFGEAVTGTFEVSGHGFRELPGPFTGHLTATGTGDLAGMTLRATFGNGPVPRTVVIKGQILEP